MSDETYSISELAERAGVTPRTIRYYAAEGLLPPPSTQGRYARYDDDHFQRLRLIAQLKDAYLPLHEIRQRVAPLDREQVEAMLAELGEKPRQLAETTSAEEYIASVIARQQPLPVPQPAPRSAPQMLAPSAPAAPSAQPTREPSRAGGFFRRFVPSPKAVQAQPATGESWRRVQLAPGVELHVGEPADALAQERIQSLIARARELFGEPSNEQ